jgi:ABC-type uncharacterized transport system substrate-binding protein
MSRCPCSLMPAAEQHQEAGQQHHGEQAGGLQNSGVCTTGVSPFISVLGAKRLGLLRELVPSSAIIAVLFNPDSPEAETVSRDAQAAARAIGQELIVLTARTAGDFDTAFATLVQKRASSAPIHSLRPTSITFSR